LRFRLLGQAAGIAIACPGRVPGVRYRNVEPEGTKMKSVLIISVVTFFLIFGGLGILSSQLGGNPAGQNKNPESVKAMDADLIIKGLEAERSLVRREKEELITLRQAAAVQELVMEEGRRELEAMSREIEARTRILNDEQERSVSRLAKMYENMKPAQAAPILSALEMDILLDIMNRMKEREAARILAQMDAGLAARISTELSLGGTG
jgi:flagellar motility protein MotE (MotC chaperone)